MTQLLARADLENVVTSIVQYIQRPDSYLATYIIGEYIKHLYVTGKRDPNDKIVTRSMVSGNSSSRS